jgi:7-cyano-7-deazaguanine synthase
MDSTVLLYQRAKDIKLAVSFNYGSKHNDQEYKRALVNTESLKIKHIRIDLPFVGEYFKSDLLKSGGEIPEGHYEDPSMKRTVVPFRNGIMLAIAVGLAESNGLQNVMLANHAGDHAIYPDCRQEFVEAFSLASIKGTYDKTGIFAPYTLFSKRQIAELGIRLKVNFSHTYSCYKGGDVHCGVCGTCVERKEALQGLNDPTKYLA